MRQRTSQKSEGDVCLSAVMFVILIGVALLPGCTVTTQTANATNENDQAMVISPAWSSPDARYLRLHSDEWEKRPFTGTLVHLYKYPYAPAGCVEMGSGFGLSWSAFQKDRYTDSMLNEAIADMQATKLTRSKYNFLWIVSYLHDAPRYFDWYDEERWVTVLNNIEGLVSSPPRYDTVWSLSLFVLLRENRPL